MTDQTNWRWCHRCEGLFRDIGPWGACPAGGFHEAVGSGSYIVELNPQVNAQEAG